MLQADKISSHTGRKPASQTQQQTPQKALETDQPMLDSQSFSNASQLSVVQPTSGETGMVAASNFQAATTVIDATEKEENAATETVEVKPLTPVADNPQDAADTEMGVVPTSKGSKPAGKNATTEEEVSEDVEATEEGGVVIELSPQGEAPPAEPGAPRAGAPIAAAAEGSNKSTKIEEVPKPARMIDMVEPALDGGPERMKKKTEAEQGQVLDSLTKDSEAAVEKAKKGISKLGQNEQKTNDAATKIEQSRSAVVIKPQEKQSEANAAQVNNLDGTKAPEQNESKITGGIGKEVAAILPETIEGADEFKDSKKAPVASKKVMNQVKGEASKVGATYSQIENTPPPQAPPTPTALPEAEAAPETPTLNIGKDVVPEVSDEQTDLTEYVNESDNLLKKEGISEENLEMVDSGDLAKAKKERAGLKEKAENEPKKAKEFEKQQRATVEKDLDKEEKAEKKAMRDKRRKALSNTGKDQQKAKTELEKKREEVTNHINSIYEAANTKVKQKLLDLGKTSMLAFDLSVMKATQTFESNIDRRFKAFKKKRYDVPGGKWEWFKDIFRDLNELQEVKDIFDSERALFVRSMDTAVKVIMQRSKAVIQECKDIIAQAKTDIQEYIDGLEPALNKIGEQAQKDVNGKLDALTKEVDEASAKLKKKLDEKRKAAIEAIDKRIEEIKASMSGLLNILGNLLLDAMMKFFSWALEKMGYSKDQLMEIINKGKATITAIVTDPIGFLGNLVDAVGLGISNFGKNILKHIMSGLIQWLTGAVGGLIQIPKEFTLSSVFGMVLDVMGLSWAYLRGKLVKRLGKNGERMMQAAETGFTVVKVLVTDGVMGLWEWIKEKAGEMKDAVIQGIRDWAIQKIVETAMIKLLSMLNPAGAIFQAIMLIYDVIMFFVNNMQRIIAMVESIINSVSKIAAGQIGDAANWIENSMARTIPMILDFLARLLNLDGIGKKVQQIIKKLRKKVDEQVDKGLDFVEEKVRGWFGKGKKDDGKEDEEGAEDEGWGSTKAEFTTESGEKHKVIIVEHNGKPILEVHSKEHAVLDYLDRFEEERGDELTDKRKGQLADARSLVKGPILDLMGKIDKAVDAKKPDKEIDPWRRELLKENIKLGNILRLMMNKPEDAIFATTIERYKLEGLTGTFGSIPQVKDDKFTPDHQPQNALFEYLAKKDYFKEPGVENLRTRAKTRSKQSESINLYHDRHAAGRTYGGDITEFTSKLEPRIEAETKGENKSEKKRDIAVQLLKVELREDVRAMKAVYSRGFGDAIWSDLDEFGLSPEEKQEIVVMVVDRVKKGEDVMAAQNLDRLKN